MLMSSIKIGRRGDFVGRLAAVTQIIFAGLIGGVSTIAGASEPEFVPRGIVVFGTYALPGIIGLIGVLRLRPGLLVAASIAAAIGSFLAFSGVTLIFLVPALLFAAGATRLRAETDANAPRSLSGLLTQMGVAAALVVLVLGAGSSALLIVDEGCWTAYQTQTGVRHESKPWSTGEVMVPAGAISTGCSTGLISARGVGLGGALGAGAIGLAWLSTKRLRAAPAP